VNAGSQYVTKNNISLLTNVSDQIYDAVLSVLELTLLVLEAGEIFSNQTLLDILINSCKGNVHSVLH